MLRSIKELKGYTIGALDGEIGTVTDFYFDDQTWTVRYLIVETGNWLTCRKVLLSTASLDVPDWNSRTFPVNLTREQVKNSPDLDTNNPVTRRQERELHEHYTWPNYWGTGFYTGGHGMWGVINAPRISEGVVTGNDDHHDDEDRDDDVSIVSCNQVSGYFIRATDDVIGDVTDFLVDDTLWNIRFMMVDTGNWLPGKNVLISPRWIEKFERESSWAYVNMNVEQITHSPEYDPSNPVQESYEQRLHEYYGKDY